MNAFSPQHLDTSAGGVPRGAQFAVDHRYAAAAAIQQFERFAETHDAKSVPRVELDRLLLETLCNPSLNIPAASVDAIGAKHADFREAISTCFSLNEILGAPLAVAAEPDRMRLAPGDEVGVRDADGRRRYRIVELLGTGRGGAVYKAVDQLLSSESNPAYVAVKVFTGVDADVPHRLIDEARRARRISHPNVAHVFDAGYENGCAYCVSELLAGESLADRSQSGMSWRNAARLLAQIADGVAAIHAAGVVHSDIKPSNIVFRDGSTPVIVDFGSAVEYENPVERVGAFTLAFAAPEQVSGGASGPIPANDIYSLGSVASWLLTGEPAAGRGAEEVIQSHMRTAPCPVDRIERTLRARGVPQGFRAIITRATARQPMHRYGTAHLIAEDLRSLVASKPIEWTAPGPLKRGGLHVRRRPVGTFLGLVAVVGGALGVAQNHKADYLSQEVAEQRTLAAVERANVEAERAWKIEAGTRLQGLLRGLSMSQAKGMHEEVLLSLWLLEWTHNDGILHDPDALDQIWQSRIDVLRDLQLKHPGTLLARLADPSLALWLIAAGEAEEALAITERAIEQMEPVAGPDDPWLARLSALRDIAAISIDTSDPSMHASAIESLRSRAEVGELDGFPAGIRTDVLRAIKLHSP